MKVEVLKEGQIFSFQPSNLFSNHTHLTSEINQHNCTSQQSSNSLAPKPKIKARKISQNFAKFIKIRYIKVLKLLKARKKSVNYAFFLLPNFHAMFLTTLTKSENQRSNKISIKKRTNKLIKGRKIAELQFGQNLPIIPKFSVYLENIHDFASQTAWNDIKGSSEKCSKRALLNFTFNFKYFLAFSLTINQKKNY